MSTWNNNDFFHNFLTLFQDLELCSQNWKIKKSNAYNSLNPTNPQTKYISQKPNKFLQYLVGLFPPAIDNLLCLVDNYILCETNVRQKE